MRLSPFHGPLSMGQTITTPQVTHTQTYTYDGINRPASVQETESVAGPQNWSMNFGHDAFGNLWTTTALPIGGATPSSRLAPTAVPCASPMWSSRAASGPLSF